MVPETNVIRVPEGWTVERRAVCQPRSDEVPTVRDASGRVLAQIETWVPEHYTAASRPS